ncbi:MAG TPA: response regulator [Phycisphaerales bacterium]
MNERCASDAASELGLLRRRLVWVLAVFTLGVVGAESLQSHLLGVSAREAQAINLAVRHQLLGHQMVKAAAMLEHANHGTDAGLSKRFREELLASAGAFEQIGEGIAGGTLLARGELSAEERAEIAATGGALLEAAANAAKTLQPDAADKKRDSRLWRLAAAQFRFGEKVEAAADRLTRDSASHAAAAMWIVLGAGAVGAGAVAAMVAMLIVPSLRRAGAEVMRARAASERALSEAQRKEAMLERVSHSIRAPMMSVLGYSDMLLEPGLSTQERSEIANSIRRSTKHLLALVHEVIDQAAAGAGKLAVGRVPCSPEQAIHEVVTMLRPLATTRKLALSEQIDASLPAAVIGDPIRLRQVLLQLVGNAIKFTPQGEIVVTGRGDPADASRVVIEIRDTGRGMTLEQLARHGLTAETAVTGLESTPTMGLGLARTLVLLMGGTLTGESAAGHGTVLRVSLAKAAASPMSGQTRGHDMGVYPWLVGNVLVAEDNSDSQKLIAFYLRKMGLQSIIVPDGRQAVNNALAAVGAGNPFDMILMDMQMPSLDGYAATRELRARGYKGVIVALTANALAGDREKCLDVGCTEYLTKPIERDVFVETCSRLLCRGEDPGLRIAS